MTQSADMHVTHWGSDDYRPTSLHGNGASSFARATVDPAKVTCRLCVVLLANSESLSWVDRHGDVWRVGEDGLMHTPETAPFPREYVEKKWGPLRLAKVTPPAQTAENGPPDEPMSWADLPRIIEGISPSSMAAHLDPSRPYDGQPHTDHGERGRTEVKGITFRDLRDCFIRACYESSGLPIEQWPGTVYDLPWDEMDIIAVAQNLSCNVEKAMGIYPNVPRLYPTDPTEPHWCGPLLDSAVYRAHEGHCDDADKRVIPPGSGQGS